jgi:beta-glucosidase-like glycosyl hydrolase
MGVEFVKGLQGNDPRYFKVIATPKHYAVHSGPEPERTAGGGQSAALSGRSKSLENNRLPER